MHAEEWCLLGSVVAAAVVPPVLADAVVPALAAPIETSSETSQAGSTSTTSDGLDPVVALSREAVALPARDPERVALTSRTVPVESAETDPFPPLTLSAGWPEELNAGSASVSEATSTPIASGNSAPASSSTPDTTPSGLSFDSSSVKTASMSSTPPPTSAGPTNPSASMMSMPLPPTGGHTATLPSVVISEVSAGAGFVEVFNRGSVSVNLNTWSVQYADAGSSSWSVTALSGTLAPGERLLVRMGGDGSGLPTPDVVGTTEMNAEGGKVALVRSATPLSESPVNNLSVMDLVGYGTADAFEAEPATEPTPELSLQRLGHGRQDTQNNAVDFGLFAPTPQNRARSENYDPWAINDAVTLAEDSPATVVDLLGNDSDPDGDALTLTSVDEATHGHVVFENGVATYRPDADFTGMDAFSYTITDARGLSASATVNVTVSAANDAPVIAGPTAVTMYAGSVLTLSDSSALLEITDADAGSEPIAVTLSVPSGSFTLTRTDGLTFTQGDGTNDTAMAFTGSVLDVNRALNGLAYVAPTGIAGSVALSVTVNDQGNSGVGGPLADDHTLTITVTPAPQGLNLAADTCLDGAINAEDELLEDDAIGKLVWVNNDDDDGNLIEDKDTVGVVASENDLMAVWLSPPVGGGTDLTGWQVRLSLEQGTGVFRVWGTPDKQNLLGESKTWVIGTDLLPTVVYVEASAVGSGILAVDLLNPQGALADGVWDTVRLNGVNFDLDVDKNGSVSDAVDGVKRYRPGYEGDLAKLSTGSYNTLRFQPQGMALVLPGLGTNAGVSRVRARLSDVSTLQGFASNGVIQAGTYQDDVFDFSLKENSDADSLSVQVDFNPDGGRVETEYSWIPIYCKDYGAKGTAFVEVFSGGHDNLPSVSRGRREKPFVKDDDGDRLQDDWEREEVARYMQQYACGIENLALNRLNVFDDNLWDDELTDPDGVADGDGGVNMVAHKTKGDSLTAFQEYRGFILDGGGHNGAGNNGHAGGHKRLSPALKEILVEVDAMKDVQHMPSPAQFPGVMEDVAKGYSDATHGAGIRAYWVFDQMQEAKVEFTADAPLQVKWAQEHKNSSKAGLGEFMHLMFVNTVVSGEGGSTVFTVGSFISISKKYEQATEPRYGPHDLGKALSTTSVHELTHALLDAVSVGGLDDEEHPEDPDLDGFKNAQGDRHYMMFGTTRETVVKIWFDDLTRKQLDLLHKEGVERFTARQ